VVTIRRVFDYTANNVRPVSAKEVKLVDEQGNQEILEQFTLGYYEMTFDENHPFVKMQNGDRYQLQITTFDGRSYETNFEPLLKAPEIENIDVSVFKKNVVDGMGNNRVEDYFLFTVSSNLDDSASGEKARVRYEMERTFKISDTPMDPLVEPKTCYISGNVAVSRINIIDGNQLSSGIVSDIVYPKTEGSDLRSVVSIKTDIDTNGAESGSPLIDMLGEVVGIYTADGESPVVYTPNTIVKEQLEEILSSRDIGRAE